MKKLIGRLLGVQLSKKRLNAVIIALLLNFALIAGLLSALIFTAAGQQRHLQKREALAVKSGEMIELNDNSLGNIRIPAIEGMAKSTLKSDGFTSDDTFIHYNENGKSDAYCGIDVSSFQGDIDWDRVKSSGVEFAMLRLGGRGYTEGEIYEDEMFEQNLEKAQKAGIKVGAYFFSQATTEQEVREEAQFTVSKLKNCRLDYPVAFDWEIIGTSEARTDTVSSEELTKFARIYCDIIEKAGFVPMIYTSSRLGYFKYDLSQLSDIDLWYVEYDDTPDFYYDFAMWQYSESAVIDGISGEVDLNLCFKEY